MATEAKLTISVTRRGVIQAQRALERLQNSAKKAQVAVNKFGASAKSLGSKTLTGLEKSVKSFSNFLSGNGSSAMSKMAGRIGGLIKSFGGMKAAIIAVIALQLARWLKVAAQAAIEFNTALANIATLIPDQITKVREYGDEIQRVAITYGKSQKDIADATYQTISAFGDLDNTFQIVDIAAQASTAGLASTADAVNLLATVSKGYNDTSTETIQKISDLAFTTVKLGQTTFPELANSMGAVVPLASALGVSMEELFAVGATLTGVTGNTSEVYTQLASVLTATVKPTKELQEVMGGLSGKEFIEESGGLAGALQAIKKASEESGNELAAYLGRKEGLIATLALTGAQADTYREKLEQEKNTYGATLKALQQQTDGVNRFGFTLKKLKSNLDTLKTGIGDFTLPFLANVAPQANLVIDLLKGLFTALTGIARLAEAITRPLRAMMIAPAKALLAFTKLLLDGLGKALTFISDLINGLIFLFKSEFIKTFEQIKKIILETVNFGFLDFIDALDASQIALDIFITVMKVLGPTLTIIVGLVETLVIAFTTLSSVSKSVGEILKNTFTLNFKGVAESGKELAENLVGSFKRVKEVGTRVGRDIKQSMNNELKQMSENAKRTFNIIESYRKGDAGTGVNFLDATAQIRDQLDKQLQQIDRNAKAIQGTGIAYDVASEKSQAYESALKSLMASGNVSTATLNRFIDDYQKYYKATGKATEGSKDLIGEFKKQIESIDKLDAVYKDLGIAYDATNEKSDAYNKTLEKLAESGLYTTDQIKAFANEFKDLNSQLENNQSLFEKAKDAAKDFSDVLQEGVFYAFADIKGIAPDFALVMSDMITQLSNAGIESTVASFKALGKAMADGAVSGREFMDIIVDQLQALLDMLPTLFVQAGLQLIAANPQANLGIGLGFIAAGLSSAIVSGLTEGLTADSSGTTANANGNAFSGNIVPFANGGAFTNSIVNTPTMFKFANGTGLMGEAGAEAIVPLTRTQSGELGVKSIGGASNIVNINVKNENGSNVNVNKNETENGIDIEVIVQNAVNKGFNSGKFDKTITSRYDTKQRGVG